MYISNFFFFFFKFKTIKNSISFPFYVFVNFFSSVSIFLKKEKNWLVNYDQL